MLSTDRQDFAPRFPYEDAPQYIGIYLFRGDVPFTNRPIGGWIGYNATISAPHMHASALEHLEPFLRPGMKALDVGSGSGYLAVCMAKMVGSDGKVVGVDHIPELVQDSRANVAKSHQDLLEGGQVVLETADGRKGYAPEAPYDCIHVGAAYEEQPQELVDQLKSPGRMFIPLGYAHGAQSIYLFDKDADGRVHKKPLMDVQYVPLTSADQQWQRN